MFVPVIWLYVHTQHFLKTQLTKVKQFTIVATLKGAAMQTNFNTTPLELRTYINLCDCVRCKLFTFQCRHLCNLKSSVHIFVLLSCRWSVLRRILVDIMWCIDGSVDISILHVITGIQSLRVETQFLNSRETCTTFLPICASIWAGYAPYRPSSWWQILLERTYRTGIQLPDLVSESVRTSYAKKVQIFLRHPLDKDIDVCGFWDINID